MTDLENSVWIFAYNSWYQTVGAGECWDFAQQALDNAGAKTSYDFGPVGAKTDYKWGQSIPLVAVQPGDILQFKNFKSRTTTSDGSWSESERPHHTAIVAWNYGHGLVEVYEQNFEGDRTVQKNFIHLSSGTSEGERTTVSGKVWAYKPVAKQ